MEGCVTRFAQYGHDARATGNLTCGTGVSPVSNDRRTTSRGGFTVIELLVVLGIILILLSIFVPYLMAMRESDRRVRCAENLKQIRDALKVYAANNGGSFPRVVYDPAGNPNGYVAFSGSDASDPFARNSAVQPNDVTASLRLLVRLGLIRDVRVFVCPSSGGSQDPLTDARGQAVAAPQRGNFRRSANLSYGYASPFSTTPGYHVNGDQPSDFAIMADRGRVKVDKNHAYLGPAMGAPPLELARGNSGNHHGAGQNVLYAGGNVAFQTTPYCGVKQDNIYTALWPIPLETGHSPPPGGNGYWGPRIGPSWYADSYLVPVEGEGP